MTSRSLSSRFLRLSSLLLACAAGSAFADAPAPVTSAQFLPGWQDHLHPLYFRGPSHLDPARDIWTLFNTPAPGRYVLVQRKGDQVALMPGYQFRIGNDPFEIVQMLLPPCQGDVDAMPLEYVPKTLQSNQTHGFDR